MRHAVALLALVFVAEPVAAEAQRAGPVPKIGVLRAPLPGDATYRALLQGLHELGYAEGKDCSSSIGGEIPFGFRSSPASSFA